jgi:hypothetical protein
MLLDRCLTEISRMCETSNSIKNLEQSIQYKTFGYIEERDNVNELLLEINCNFKRDLKLQLISCETEIQAIEDELLHQACIRIQRFFRKSIKYHFCSDLLSLDNIRQYKQYLMYLKKDLDDTRLNILLSSDELTSFKNDYLIAHIKIFNQYLLTQKDLILEYEKKKEILIKKNESSHELICKLGGKMNLIDIMKIQAKLKHLKEYPNYTKLLDDFINNVNMEE